MVLARTSRAYDVLNGIGIDARIEHYRTGELSLCERHLPCPDTLDLLIMDRAYAAFWPMAALHHQKKSFSIRVKANRWKPAKQFPSSKKKEQLIEVGPGNEAVKPA